MTYFLPKLEDKVTSVFTTTMTMTITTMTMTISTMTRTRTNIPLHYNDIQGSITKSLQNRHLGCEKIFNELFRTNFFYCAANLYI